MFHGVLALLTRSLRQDARQLRNHIFRLAFVGFIYMGLLFASLTAGSFGAPGLIFFKAITYLNALFVTCAGIGFFATAITEEKEEETIGLLTMAGLNPLGILLGKSTSRLIQASMLLIVQFPFLLLSVTLGGVTPYQILAAYMALLAFMAMLANVALVWSTVCERGGIAAGMTALLLVVYCLLPWIASPVATELSRVGLTTSTWFGQSVFTALTWASDGCVFYRLSTIMETGFKDPLFSHQVIADLIVAMVFFCIAWAIFGPATRRSAAGGSRGLVTRSTGRVRLFSPGRSWAMPLAWKDFQFIAGGYGFAVVKLFAYAILLAGIAFLSTSWGGYGVQWSNIGELYVFCLFWAVVIEACILASRIFHDEVRLQTLSSLMMLPRSIPYLAYTKALGCLLGLAPSIACLALGSLLLPGIDLPRVGEFLINPATWGCVLGITIFLHLVALLSLFVKWGALPLAIVIMAPLSVCCPVWQLLFYVIGRQGGIRDSVGSLAATATVWILMALVCFVFQMMIAARLQEIGSK